MRFDFSAEQRMLAESVRRALEELGPTRLSAGAPIDQTRPGLPELGETLTRLGLFGLLVPEEQGGLGLGMVEAVAVAMEIGRAAVPFPAAECMVAMTVAARTRPDVLAEVLDGSAFVTAPVHGELSIDDAPRMLVRGTVSLPFAREARYVLAPLVEARTVLLELDDGRGEPIDALDLTYPLNRVEIRQAVSGNQIVAGRAGDMLGILAAAEIVGAAEHCLDRTVSYLKERRQFETVVGSFQSLKHIAADCRMQIEAMKASVEYAAAVFDKKSADTTEAKAAFHMAKAYCSEFGLKIAEQCVQMHGGIAFTWEYGLHLHFRRITRLASSRGAAYAHREALAGLAFAGARVPGGLAADPRLAS